MKGVLVVGLGNAWRGDDAAGLEAARRLRVSHPSVRALEWEGEPLGLLDLWEGADLVIVIDAVSADHASGEIVRFDAIDEPIPATYSQRGTHAVGLAEAIELARALHRLPRSLIVFGIEARRYEAGEAISDEVARAIDHVVGLVNGELRARAV